MSAENGTAPATKAESKAAHPSRTKPTVKDIVAMTDEEYAEFRKRSDAELDDLQAKSDDAAEKVRKSIEDLVRENARLTVDNDSLRRSNKVNSRIITVLGALMFIYGLLATLSGWGVI